jgi:hypothetical protein
MKLWKVLVLGVLIVGCRSESEPRLDLFAVREAKIVGGGGRLTEVQFQFTTTDGHEFWCSLSDVAVAVDTKLNGTYAAVTYKPLEYGGGHASTVTLLLRTGDQAAAWRKAIAQYIEPHDVLPHDVLPPAVQ